VPGFKISVTALETRWGPSAQKWSLYHKGKKLREKLRKVREKNGGQVE